MSEAYITVLINDGYLAGALVLGRSLRDLGTKRRLVVLVANVSEDSIELLKEVWDEIINIQPILSTSLEELHLLGRPDLVSTYTKILIWDQIKFDKVVYLDSDVLPIVSIDELFELQFDEGIAASPDAGWPDIFNSGVFVTRPTKTIFKDLLKLIQTSDTPSFDGADQGLLNEYFLGNWKRLPFTFNVTPSAGYQYVPAYARFRKDIKLVHFIGINKPWLTRDSNVFASGSFGKGYDVLFELHKSWWKVFNKYYFGNVAGKIFELANVSLIVDQTYKGEAWNLSVPKLQNKWETTLAIRDDSDDVALDEDDEEEESEESQAIPQIFPWESRREEPSRYFDDSTDFHVEDF